MSNSLVPGDQTIRPGSNLRIEVHAGPLAGKGYPFIEERVTLGRAPDNDMVLDDSQVSRYHAVLRRQGNEVVLQDLGSTNGTLVNGDRVYGEHVLQPTETITIGSSVMSVMGFPAPSTVSMAATQLPDDDSAFWSSYQSPSPQVQQSSMGGSNWLLFGGVIALLVMVIAIAGAAAFMFWPSSNNTSTGIPVVIISSPVSGSQFRVSQRIFVQATATDVEGVVRMELWVAGQKVDEAISPVQAGQSPFTDNLAWTPSVDGTFSLEVRAFNSQGRESQPTIVNVSVAPAPGQDTGETPITETASPDPNSIPVATVRTDLNVRAGPDTSYDIIGALPANSTVPIAGKNADGSWWYIEYPTGPERRGWIAAEFAPSQNAGGVPVVDTPTPQPSPTTPAVATETATNTPAPATPTATTVAASATPSTTPSPTSTPTNTPVPETAVSFTADTTTIQQGQCTNLRWKVSNVREVYLDGTGVAGDDNGQPVVRQVCPSTNTIYRLRVVRANGSEEVREITISVTTPLTAPSDLRLLSVTGDRFQVAWNDNSNNEDGFRVYDADRNRVLATFDDDVKEGLISNLECNRTYRLFVVAFNQAAESAPSNIMVEQTLDCP